MSPRKPAVLRDGDGQDLRGYLITTAARLIDERGSAGLGVRDIAREAQVADGVLYNYFEDKEDLLAHALLAHVATVMEGMPQMPPAGTGTVAENLRQFIDIGIGALARVVPAFAGLPGILTAYLRAEQRLGRIHEETDVDAAVTLVVGAIHGQILPRVLFSPPGSSIMPPPDLAGRLAQTVVGGIAPGSPHR